MAAAVATEVQVGPSTRSWAPPRASRRCGRSWKSAPVSMATPSASRRSSSPASKAKPARDVPSPNGYLIQSLKYQLHLFIEFIISSLFIIIHCLDNTSLVAAREGSLFDQEASGSFLLCVVDHRRIGGLGGFGPGRFRLPLLGARL